MSGKKQPLNGKPGLKHSRQRSNNETRPSPSKVELLLAAVYDAYQRREDPQLDAQSRRDFVFHMTDWSDDLQALADLYQNPDKYDEKTAGRLVAGFLYHAIPHLRAAGRLLLDYEPTDFFRTPDGNSL